MDGYIIAKVYKKIRKGRFKINSACWQCSANALLVDDVQKTQKP